MPDSLLDGSLKLQVGVERRDPLGHDVHVVGDLEQSHSEDDG